MNIFDISKYQIMDPFFFELQIINFQRRWYFYKNHKYKQLIVKNIKQLINYNDPITLNCFFNNNKLKDINYLYPIFRNNNMYIYYLTSLKDLFENKQNEIYTNREFTTVEINHINFDKTDNRLENLQILCPNCHSQTITYCTGKKIRDKNWIKPSKEELTKALTELKNPKELLIKYNICYETLRNWIKEYELYYEYIKENDAPKEKDEYKCSKCNTDLTFRNKTGLCRYCKSKRP